MQNHQKYVRKTAFLTYQSKKKTEEEEDQLQHQANHAKSKGRGTQHVEILRVRWATHMHHTKKRNNLEKRKRKKRVLKRKAKTKPTKNGNLRCTSLLVICGAQLLRKMIKAEDHIRSSQAQKYPSCSKIPHWFPFAHTVQDWRKKTGNKEQTTENESVSDVSKKCNSSLDINTDVMRKTKHSTKKRNY